ncbi:hypothetical protein, partial [Anoxybacillus sp. LAT_11]|uniref:hypothetical protein n=1 Tax=Anoxybacillus sp. LAT_11 TaxID=2862718 RepID=UPI001EEAE63D
ANQSMMAPARRRNLPELALFLFSWFAWVRSQSRRTAEREEGAKNSRLARIHGSRMRKKHNVDYVS